MRSPARVAATLACLVSGLALLVPGTAGAALFSTTISYTGPTLIGQGGSATLSANLSDSGFSGVAGRTVQLTLGSGVGSQSCSATTDAFGDATCAIASVTVAAGTQTVTATFAGDDVYDPSSDSKSVTVYGVNNGFVLGDRTVQFAPRGATVEWWGAEWWKENDLTGGGAPPSFKGFADLSRPATTCGGTWTSRPGNSSSPPAAVPPFMAVIVSTKIRKSGSTISGDIRSIAVVKTDPGYGPAPGHRGTGQVVGYVCGAPEL